MSLNHKKSSAKAFRRLCRACVVISSALFLALAILTIFLLWATADSGQNNNTSVGRGTPDCGAQLLPQEVIADLCDRGLVPGDLGGCDAEIPPLRREHTEAIIRAGVEINSSAHQLVKEEFGRYEVSCSAADRYGNYTCDYDLSEEGPVIGIVYDAATHIARSVFVQKTDC